MGVTLIFSYILRPGLFLGVQNFDFQYFYFFFLKKLNILEYEDFVNIFWGHHKIGLYLDVISMHFRVLSESQGKEWRIFFGLLKFQIFIWGA